MNKELVIKSKLENMSLVENFIDEVSVCLSIVSDLYGNLLISTIEAVTNAIVHGNNSDPEKLVHIDLVSDDKKIDVTITDEGQGFDVNIVPDPTKPDYIEKPNGRGIFLMKNLADDVKFDKNGSVVTLTFNF
ncbi:MAG: ATP-binding protein [Salinivirgaceae bacterium]|jgi:serine/threonine-protein kinase RsbW|nr:ATP-binding protein [Salinivirgaceae bacterium]MBR3567539.1 ATP-binding protein [Salinivirgaceae bacterium]